MWDRLLLDCHAASMDPARPGDYGAVENAAVACHEGRIAWFGAASDLPDAPERLAHEVESLGGAWITPGLVDCHTHAVFGGERIGEFERRLNGESYAAISKAGGGIRSTVSATREAGEDALTESAIPRLQALRRGGVSAVEIKSGYGLTTESEIAMLRAAGRAAQACGMRVKRTFLGLHALPEEYTNDRAGYVRLICEEALPKAHAEGLVDAVDAFCETIAFTPDEVRTLFEAAQALGLPVRLHAEQLSDQGGAALAAGFGALSADHLEYLSQDGVAAMAAAGTVAVLLPGAFYALNETRKPPVAALREAGVPIALATDLNPGSSPLVSPTLAMNMGCVLFGLTPAEALAGMTRNGTKAMGMGGQAGVLAADRPADIAVWRVGSPAEIAYWIGLAGPERLLIGGEDAP